MQRKEITWGPPILRGNPKVVNEAEKKWEFPGHGTGSETQVALVNNLSSKDRAENSNRKRVTIIYTKEYQRGDSFREKTGYVQRPYIVSGIQQSKNHNIPMRKLIKAGEIIHLRELERRMPGTHKRLEMVPISNNQTERKEKKK